MSDEDKRNDDEPDAEPSGDDAPDTEDELTVDDILADAPDDGQAAEDTVTVLQTTLEERTRDLQRLNAEFQNYRKRVERDKARAGEAATAAVLSSLLPILDDLDRARNHGDLTGPFGSVAEQLIGTLNKQGLESFGEKGDTFDPTVHEAVAHMQMPDVDGPTCIDVMRPGYRLGDRLIRAAMVAVAEPPDEAPGDADADQTAADGADSDEGESTESQGAADGADSADGTGGDDGTEDDGDARAAADGGDEADGADEADERAAEATSDEPENENDEDGKRD